MEITIRSREELVAFLRDYTVTVTEAAEMLECSRQNIFDLVRRNKLQPVKEGSALLFLRADVEARVNLNRAVNNVTFHDRPGYAKEEFLINIKHGQEAADEFAIRDAQIFDDIPPDDHVDVPLPKNPRPSAKGKSRT